MKLSLATVVLLGSAVSILADETPPKSTKVRPEVELKSTPDALPDGMRNFNGMLLGRLAAKDVEKGTFLVRVDAVPRVWRNSKAEDPKSVVGKTVKVNGVFGKFLDVLVVTRKGETLEFECKHDGDGLTFPGEMLRKVAPFDPKDFPVLPEEFRGFHGAILADIKKKDPETMEMIVEVRRVTDTWKDNKAKKPESIQGKQMMLAGFWTRKEAYLKGVGVTVPAGLGRFETAEEPPGTPKIALTGLGTAMSRWVLHDVPAPAGYAAALAADGPVDRIDAFSL